MFCPIDQHGNFYAMFSLSRLTAIQTNDLYDLMVTDRETAEQQNYGDNSLLLCTVILHLLPPPTEGRKDVMF